MGFKDRGGWTLVIFLTGNVCFAAGIFVHAFSFNFYLRELGFSPVVMGQQVTAMTVGGLAALLPAGVVIDRLGTRTALFGGVAITTAGLVLGAVVRDATWILAAAVVIGAGAATCRVAWGPAIMRITDATQRARAFSWNVAVLIASGSVWTVLAGALPERSIRMAAVSGFSGTQLVLLGGAAVTALAAVCYWPLRLGPATRTPVSMRLPRLPREVRSLVPIVAFWMLAAALVQPFFNIFFADRFRMPVAWIGSMFAGAHVVTAVVLVGAAEAVRRWGPQRALVWWVVLFAPSLWCLSVASGMSIAIGLYFLQGLVPPATNPLIDQLVLERVPQEQHGVVAGWRHAAAEVAGAVGATAGGHLLVAASFSGLFLAAGAVAAVAGLLLVAVLRAGPARLVARPTDS